MSHANALTAFAVLAILLSSCISSRLVRAEEAARTSVTSPMGPESCTKADMSPVKIKLKNGDEFEIPAAYLYDPYGIYHEDRQRASLISLRVHLKDFSPVCGKEKKMTSSEWRQTFLTISLNSKDKSGLAGTQMLKKNYPVFIKHENKDLDLYREKMTKADDNLRHVRDLFIPRDKNLFPNLAIKCFHSRDAGMSNQLTGCGFTLELSDNLAAICGADSSIISNFPETTQKIHQLINGFMVKKL